MSAYGNALLHVRTCLAIKDRRRGRRRCQLWSGPGLGTCTRPCTHLGLANGVALMSGCEWHVRRWVRDPGAGIRRAAR